MNACNPKAYTIPGVDAMQAELATQRQPAPLLLAPVGDKTVELDFDGGRLSSDAGLVLLKDIDEQLGLTRALAAVLSDPRDARRIHFTPADLLKQRMFQIAAGYEDANDCQHPTPRSHLQTPARSVARNRCPLGLTADDIAL